MLVIHNELRIYFGDTQDFLYPHEYLALSKNKNILKKNPFAKLQKSLNIKQLLFLKQTHSTEGLIIDNKLIAMPSFNYKGDFLLTNLATIGLGIMTADCVPLIIYDTAQNITAIVHAGWKGTINNIAITTVNKMKKLLNSNLSTLQIIFGPSAKKCCYTVRKDFVAHLKKNSLIDCKKVLQKKNDSLFFDLPGCNQLLLEKIGIKKNTFYFDYNFCTICNSQYFSHRRQGKQAGRQMTVVSLQHRAN